MDDKNLLIVPALYLKSKENWTEKDFKSAIKKFTRNAPMAPIPRLYDSYKWLKDKLDDKDEDSNKQFTYFIEHLLRILEERGAGKSEIYSEILRDSAEYKYLKGLFHTDESDDETADPDIAVKRSPAKPIAKKNSLKNILLKKGSSLLDIDINSWKLLVSDYFEDFTTDESFEKNCTSLIKKISKREKKESYHVEIIVVYAFDRLLKNKNLSLQDKYFAMQLLNFTTGQGEAWNRLHTGYLEIIRK